jgi:hypothetical protein
MRSWLRRRIGRPVYLRFTEEGRTIMLSRVRWWPWSTVEGVDADGDEACVKLRTVTTAFAGPKVAEGFEITRELRRKIHQAAHGVCDCEECQEKQRREAQGQLSPEEIAAVLAEDGIEEGRS